MRKAIQLKATIYVEGDADPASDFARLAMGKLRDVIKAGSSAAPGLKITVKRLVENRSEGDDSDDSAGADPAAKK